VFLVAARPLIGAFSQDGTVLAIGPSLLAIAGVCLVSTARRASRPASSAAWRNAHPEAATSRDTG